MKIVFTLIILLCSYISISQEGKPRNKNSYTVIATSGLNLRSQPHTQSTILAKLPYGTKVIHQKETTSTIDWIKVTANNQIGYLYKKYLAPYNYKFPTAKINSDYSLLLPNCTCFDNFQYDPELNWIGVHKTQKENSFQVQPISFSYYHQKATIGTEVCIEINSDNIPEFIIGSKQPLSVEQAHYSPPFEYIDESIAEALNNDFYFSEDSNELLYCYNNRDILLTEKDLRPRSIHWKGDINGDGVEDFIIKYGEKMAKLVLILSDYSGSDIAYIKVAEYYFGYCC
jgi:hypothetical protein